MKNYKKCPNCKHGVVDGGTRKRKKREIEQLERLREKEISSLKSPKTEIERKQHQSRVSKINKDYDEKIKLKENEPEKESRCSYCGGTGYLGEIKK